MDHVDRVAWLPDSARLLVAVTMKVGKWANLCSCMTDAQKRAAISLAQFIKKTSPQVGFDRIGDQPRMKQTPDWQKTASIIYLREKEPSFLRLHTDANTLKYLQEATVDVHCVNLFTPASTMQAPSVTGWRAGEGDAGEVFGVWQGFGSVEDFRISPDGKHGLFVHDNEARPDVFDVELIPLSPPSISVKVAEAASTHADWSADSKTVIYTQATNDNMENQLTVPLSAVHVIDESSASPKKTQAPETLLYLVRNRSQQIRCLKDGAIIFDSPEVTLPVTHTDLPKTENLFSFRIGDQIVRRLLAAEDTQSLKPIDSLETNPDGTYAAITNTDSNTCDVVNISTGKVTALQSAGGACWRNSDELCYVKPLEKKSANDHDAEVVLRSISTGQERVISETWPKAAVDGFLIHDKAK
jgi:hypothetical protein